VSALRRGYWSLERAREPDPTPWLCCCLPQVKRHPGIDPQQGLEGRHLVSFLHPGSMRMLQDLYKKFNRQHVHSMDISQISILIIPRVG
jgi:hypothetical protein